MAKKKAPAAAKGAELHTLSDEAPIHLPMAYAKWLPVEAVKPSGKTKARKRSKRASKSEGAA
jgi:hypothetical protein